MVRITLRNKSPAHLRAPVLRYSKGFTLVELVVVTAIIVVVSSVVLVNNNRFGGVVQLENLTYDVALSIRQAQVYGISVQRLDSIGINCADPGAQCFGKAYGMYFNTGDSIHYEFFADLNQDGFFTAGENVPPSPYTIRSGFEIRGICAPEGIDAATCMETSSVSQVHVTFKRPEADAWISAGTDPCGYGLGTCAESVRIILTSPRGDVMSVLVGANGQIAVKREASQ